MQMENSFFGKCVKSCSENFFGDSKSRKCLKCSQETCLECSTNDSNKCLKC